MNLKNESRQQKHSEEASLKTTMVFDRGLLLGSFDLDVNKNDLFTMFKDVKFDNNSPINILYMSDLNYGIVITDKMFNDIHYSDLL